MNSSKSCVIGPRLSPRSQRHKRIFYSNFPLTHRELWAFGHRVSVAARLLFGDYYNCLILGISSLAHVGAYAKWLIVIEEHVGLLSQDSRFSVRRSSGEKTRGSDSHDRISWIL